MCGVETTNERTYAMSRKKTTTTKRNTRPAAKPVASAKAARSPKSKPAEAKPATAPKADAEAAKPAEPKEAKVRKLSLLSAAAAVLAESDEPLNCRRMIDLAKERGLWTPGAGKTPEQTLYSAIMREIRDKGDAARFRKSPLRGHYLAPTSAN
jgi:hypothetical protein